MIEETLVHRKDVELNGERYEIRVYCREDGKHFAKTSFTKNDIIINDGHSLEETLKKHEKVLSLAVTCREIMRQANANRIPEM